MSENDVSILRDMLQRVLTKQEVMEQRQEDYMEASKDRRKAIDENFKLIHEERKELEKRVHCVEKKMWFATGASSLATWALTTLIGGHHK